MKITITRAFERTRQIADFVPIKAYCEATIETEITEPFDQKTEELFRKACESYSAGLDSLVQSEVEKTLHGYTPSCIRCGGKAIFPAKVLNKEGMCAQCVSEMSFQARDAAVDNARNRAAKTVQKSTTKPSG